MWWSAAAAVLTAVVGVGLLLVGDAHGFAFLGGLALGGIGSVLAPPADRLPARTR